MEIWKAFYENTRNEWCVSNHGRIKVIHKKTAKVRYPNTPQIGGHSGDGIRYFAISLNCAPEKYVHRLVASMFVPNPDPEAFTVVNHKDGNKHNNHFENLEWTDHWGNSDHAWTTGLRTNKFGQNRAEIFVRREHHYRLRATGMTYKAIGDVTGYCHQLVRLDCIRFEEMIKNIF